MPELSKLDAVIHSPIEREHYTIEKVFFRSRPGHYVSGNLYKPKGDGTWPGVLFAHGHWENGRFMEAGDAEIKKALDTKGEDTKESAKYHMQAACATLARRGIVVFQYDMVGYADSTAIGHVAKSGVPHPNGFADVQGELRLQSLMGLQTLNSLRAVDFITSLPFVNKKLIGMTGGSGGGTQTFITAALDDRITAAVPAVMVSTGMQGGCVCENCSLLRVGTGNVEIAGMIAPRPMALTCANDWTKEFMTKGFPELQDLYKLHGKPVNVTAKAWLEYGHNYNQRAREFMESFFARQLQGKDEDVKEPPFVPVPPKELSVYDDKHPRPKDDLNATALRKLITEADAEQIANLSSKPADPLNYRTVVGAALRAMICDERPMEVVVRDGPKQSQVDDCTLHHAWFGRKDESDSLPALGVFSKKFDGRKVALWIHPDGLDSIIKDGKLVPAARSLVDSTYAVVSADLYGTGSAKLVKPYAVNTTYAGFTFGYNRSLLAQRIHDILTLFGFATSMLKAKTIDIIGWGAAGPWAALARSAAMNTSPAKELVSGPIRRGAFDLDRFDFSKIEKTEDEMMLPGALKYGGLPGLMAVAFPEQALIHNATPGFDAVKAIYKAGNFEKQFTHELEKRKDEKVVEYLLN
jgi:dienelactone hydrolase